jgi:hypothetical protein|nr:MAG TPA: hypothetical protein [Caudoviricetes sp.]
MAVTNRRNKIVRRNQVPDNSETVDEIIMVDEDTVGEIQASLMMDAVEDTVEAVQEVEETADTSQELTPEEVSPLEAHANTKYLSPLAIADIHFVDRALEQIPDDFIVKNKREKEEGITKLLSTYKKYSDKSSFYPEITPETTGYEIKEAIKKMKFVEQIEMAYIFLLYSGKLHEVFDYEQETKRWRIRFLQWGGYTVLFLFVAIIGGVVTAGVIRNDIDSNEFIRMFMDLVNKFTEMFVTGTPQVPD